MHCRSNLDTLLPTIFDNKKVMPEAPKSGFFENLFGSRNNVDHNEICELKHDFFYVI